ncbi:flavin reductase family protein [Streptomyces hundungensis]|uniref:flavin reductase family protein n=1 Tax=Streptomyces hundungensis TaxID=1077946 RepID=UPI0033F3465D
MSPHHSTTEVEVPPPVRAGNHGLTVDGSALRSALRPHAAGVAVLTAAGAAGPVGVTVTSLTSVSATPALLSVALATVSNTWAEIRDCDWFGVQLLGADQAAVAQRFATRGIDRFARPTGWHLGPHGVPLIDACQSWMICSPYRQVELGDHHLMVGAVEHIELGAPAGSLVHLHGSLAPVGPARPVADGRGARPARRP